MERALNSEPFLGDGHEEVDAQSDPNLAFHSIDRGSVKRLDPQVLLDPLKKNTHLLAFQRMDEAGCRQ